LPSLSSFDILKTMPRKARIDAAGALHHIIIRGIEGRKIFRDDTDHHDFLNRIATLFTSSHTRCFAWALLPNHAHLLLQTGLIPIPTLMRRLLTGYAVSFNLKYRRHGHLFQNRYKSILCQEDPYLKELIRYIHLNPIRAGLVSNVKTLARYPWSGHSAIMGDIKRDWQDSEYVLGLFGNKKSRARANYLVFLQKGIAQGKRLDLVGGGLIRSMRGWDEVKRLRNENVRLKGDERVLGDSGFVEQILTAAQERLDRHYAYRSQGYDFDKVVQRVAETLNIDRSEVLHRGKEAKTALARSLLCYWANRELGMTTVEISRRLKISQPAVSKASLRGEKLAAENDYDL
jgi:putative transposase